MLRNSVLLVHTNMLDATQILHPSLHTGAAGGMLCVSDHRGTCAKFPVFASLSLPLGVLACACSFTMFENLLSAPWRFGAKKLLKRKKEQTWLHKTMQIPAKS